MIKEELDLIFDHKKQEIKTALAEQKASNGGFSLTLDAWTALNQV
jgi:hypothetical protein